MACPGASVGMASRVLFVFPVREGPKDQPATGPAPGKVVKGGPVIEGGQCFAGKTNLYGCANAMDSLSHSSPLWLGLGPVPRSLLSPACFFRRRYLWRSQ